MIDFRATYDNRGFVHFCNEDGESVKQYGMLRLENYVTDNRLNIVTVSANGCSSIDPNIVEEEEEINVTDYIDNNWYEVTKSFYMANNPSEYQSANRIQETRKALR